MELPGVNSDDVRLSLENNILTIRGEKKHDSEDTSERVHRFERTYGVFERTFVLLNTIDPEKIEARYENGVLFVTIPKAERAKPREIRVQSQGLGSAQVRTGSQKQQGVVGQSSGQQGCNGDTISVRDPEGERSAGRTPR
ncbi:MAG: Hsp20/alpha crystallin family protein [Gemmatimonadales bacterium]|nr:Hsp20/alpha crystallin family protein [Gemmatimonadales bacterium]